MKEVCAEVLISYHDITLTATNNTLSYQSPLSLGSTDLLLCLKAVVAKQDTVFRVYRLKQGVPA